MKEKLEILLIGLKEYKLNDARSDIVDVIDLLAEEIKKANLAIKEQMKKEIDSGNFEKLNSMSQFCKVIEGLPDELSLLKSANIYNSTTDDNYNDCLLADDDYSGTKPWRLTADGKQYRLDKNNWRSFFSKVLSVLAEKDEERFMEMVEVINSKQSDYYKFAKDRIVLEDKDAAKIVYLEHVNIFVRFSGNANQIIQWTKEAFKFFKMNNSWNVETIKE